MKKPPVVVHSRTYDNWRLELPGMPDDDARQLSPQALHRLRNEVVRRHLQGESRMQICTGCNVSYTAVRKIIHAPVCRECLDFTLASLTATGKQAAKAILDAGTPILRSKSLTPASP